MAVDRLKAQGEDTKWLRQEERDLVDLDRTQNELDTANAQTAASNAAMWGAVGNIGSAAMSTGFNMSSNNAKKDDDDTTVDPKSTTSTIPSVTDGGWAAILGGNTGNQGSSGSGSGNPYESGNQGDAVNPHEVGTREWNIWTPGSGGGVNPHQVGSQEWSDWPN
jgi:hypothetical protein